MSCEHVESRLPGGCVVCWCKACVPEAGLVERETCPCGASLADSLEWFEQRCTQCVAADYHDAHEHDAKGRCFPLDDATESLEENISE